MTDPTYHDEPTEGDDDEPTRYDLFGRPIRDDDSDEPLDDDDDEPLDRAELVEEHQSQGHVELPSDDSSSGSWWSEDEVQEETAGSERRAVVYVRVSTERQRERHHGIQAQRDRLDGLCKAHGIEVVEVVEDVCSSAIDWRARDGGQRCVELLRAGEVNTVAVLRLDRWVRASWEAHDLLRWFKKKGWELVMGDPYIDTTSAVGELTISILAAVAQLERRHIKERTKDALRARHRSMRLPIGRIRFGERLECNNCGTDYVADPTLPRRCVKCVPTKGGGNIKLRGHPRELATMGLIWKLRHEEGETYRSIAGELEVRRRLTKSGRPEWNHVVVSRIFKKLKKSKRLRSKALDALHKEKLES